MTESEVFITADRDFSKSVRRIPGERNKRKQEKVLISELWERMEAFTRGYGAISIPQRLNRVHLIGEITPEVEELTEDHSAPADAEFKSENQSIIVYSTAKAEDKRPSLLQLALAISHEMVHMYSYTTFLHRGQKAITRRGGIYSSHKDKLLQWGFGQLDEAITEELNKRFDQLYFPTISVQYFKYDLMARDNLRCLFVNPDYAADIASYYLDSDRERTYYYARERKKFNLLVNDIADKAKLESSEVFDIFARAYFNGSLLTLARLCESVYGRGSFKSMPDIAKELYFASN